MNEIKNKIKVVFWDLDDTLWKGTLAEGDEVILDYKRIDIIKELNKRGIVNSICSKNEFQKTKEKLISFGVWNLFVFSKIAFQPKGEMIKQALFEMNLREDNALFIDDNELNLREVEFYNPNISVLNSNLCDAILEDRFLEGKDDSSLSRVKQYRLLEQKIEIKKSYSSNDRFLAESGIRVEFLNYNDTLLDRLFELTERTNQLNFTKNRMSREELEALARDKTISLQMIRVIDNFGDYGIVGFYALKNQRLIHFVFSCRIMSMNIEQFVYAYLGYPELNIVGEVASSVSKEDRMPEWISIIHDDEDYEEDSIDNILEKSSEISIYALGACDLYHPIAYFDMPNQNFIYECNVFKGMERGVNVGTEYIRSLLEMSEDEKQFCRAHFYNYTGSLAFNSQIFKRKYDYVIMSFHDDEVFKIYEKKDDHNLRVILSPDKKFGLTSVINISKNESSYQEQQEWLEKTFEKGHFISRERFKDNILQIANHLDSNTKIVLITGPELDFFREKNPHCPEVREQIIKLNKVLWELEKEFPKRFAVADINKIIKSRDNITDYVYHLKAGTAYNLFVEIVWTIIRKLGRTKHEKMLSAVEEGRDVVIFGNGIEARNTFYNLKLGGITPKCYVHYDFKDKKIGSAIVEDCKTVLNEKSDKYFFVVADNSNYSTIKKMLEQTGHVALKDFVHIKPGKYKKMWNEENNSPAITHSFKTDKIDSDKCMNSFILHKQDGTIEMNPKINGLDVKFLGKGSTVELYEPVGIFDVSSICVGSNTLVSIHETKLKRKRHGLRINATAEGSNVIIGKDFSCWNSVFTLIDEKNRSVRLGDEVMLSSDVEFRPSDGHSIYDINTGELLNLGSDIVLGNHVWVGKNVYFTKGCEIANNSIVGAYTKVTKKFREENVLIAGIPGKIIKSNVNWTEPKPDCFVSPQKP